MGALNVLVVDDDEADRARVRRLLAGGRFRVDVVEAASAQEARDRLREGHFDCVVLDYWLGDAPGTELLPALQDRSGVRYPVIMVSGMTDADLVAEATHAGPDEFLSKEQLNDVSLNAAIERALGRIRSEEEFGSLRRALRRVRLFDPVTSLPNRQLFLDRLARAAGTGAPFALLAMDLSLFKAVNDALGYAAGDRVLAAVAGRLSALLPAPGDTLARIGGDEFAVILTGVGAERGAAQVAEAMVAAMEAPIDIDARRVMTGVSIGIAIAAGGDAPPQALLARANQAMNAARRNASGYEVWAGAAAAPEHSPVLIAGMLAEALERDEIFLVYQPKIDLAQGRLVGVEALVRWNSARHGMLAPGSFIPAAEQSPIIGPMTYRVLDLALEQSLRWRARGIVMPVSVNLSPRLFNDKRLAMRVMQALGERGLDGAALTLEITETALMNSPVRAGQTIRELSEAGIGISIDDFGSGYTSLRYLREFPVSELKIDRIFISNLRPATKDASIVGAVAALAQGFGIDVVAEGVERNADLDLLRSLGCNLGQGYSIGYPMPAAALDDWLCPQN